jgi:hypothetical protein
LIGFVSNGEDALSHTNFKKHLFFLLIWMSNYEWSTQPFASWSQGWSIKLLSKFNILVEF